MKIKTLILITALIGCASLVFGKDIVIRVDDAIYADYVETLSYRFKYQEVARNENDEEIPNPMTREEHAIASIRALLDSEYVKTKKKLAQMEAGVVAEDSAKETLRNKTSSETAETREK